MDRKKDKGRLSYCRLSLDDTNQMNLQLYEMALILPNHQHAIDFTSSTGEYIVYIVHFLYAIIKVERQTLSYSK